VEAIDEFEAESDQQCHEEEQERQKRRDSGAAVVDVCIQAVHHEEQASSEQPQKDHGGARIELPVEARTNRNASSSRPCMQRSVGHVYQSLMSAAPEYGCQSLQFCDGDRPLSRLDARTATCCQSSVQEDPSVQRSAISYAGLTARGLVPNRWDIIAFPLVFGLLPLAAKGAGETLAPLSALKEPIVSLDPVNLPEYALRTTLRMLAAMIASLLFTVTYGTLAAKSRRAELVLVPLLDILQSVPVLGYISFTVVFFMSLFPGRVAGAEAAAIFAIFTSQAWNMTFSFYQSLRTVPRDLEEAQRIASVSRHGSASGAWRSPSRCRAWSGI